MRIIIRMLMHNPPHPGELIKEACIEPLGLTVTEAAKGLGITRKALSEFLNGKSRISIEMAFRISKAFGGTPESWLKQQVQYDLWRNKDLDERIRVKSYKNAS